VRILVHQTVGVVAGTRAVPGSAMIARIKSRLGQTDQFGLGFGAAVPEQVELLSVDHCDNGAMG
jgi:hypothetical protein